MCRRRRIAVGHRRGALRQRPLAVDRLAHRIDDSTQPQWRRPHLTRRVGDDGTAAAPDTLEAGERHHHGIVPGEADDLRWDESIAAGLDYDAGTHRHRVNGACDLDHQAAHADDAAIYIDAIDVGDLFGECLHCENLKFPRVRAIP